MRLIKPSFEIWEQKSGYKGMCQNIERAGRVCYKSEDKITDTSAIPFVNMLISSGHGAVLEHGTVYLNIDTGFSDKYKQNPYSIVHDRTYGVLSGNFKYRSYITTNYRVLMENGWAEDIKHIVSPTSFHEKRVTVRFILDRAIANEFVRHRKFSFCQESSRYINYCKDKFGNEITFILPSWMNSELSGEYDSAELFGQLVKGKETGYKINGLDESYFLWSLANAELQYFNLINTGWKPQQARNVLPLVTKTELVMTGFVSDWKHFFDLRCALNAHPQARELAVPLKKEFIKRGYLNEDGTF